MNIKNTSVADYRRFLRAQGLEQIRSNKHEVWGKPGLIRPVQFSSHIDPVPEFVIKNGLHSLKMTKKQFEAFKP